MNFKKIEALVLAAALILGAGIPVSAANAEVIGDPEEIIYEEKEKDTGEKKPAVISHIRAEDEEETEEEEAPRELASAVLTEKPNAKKLGSKGSFVTIGETGSFDIDRNDENYFVLDDLDSLTRLTWFSSDASVLTVDSSTGAYRGLREGRVQVTVIGYSDFRTPSFTGAMTYDYEEIFSYTMNVSVLPSMTALTIDRTEASMYVSAGGLSYCEDEAGCAEFTLSGTSYVFDSTVDPGAISVTADTDYFSYKVEDNVLRLYCSRAGDTLVSASFGNKTFDITLHVIKVKQKGDTAMLLVKGRTKQLALYEVTEAGGSAEKVVPSQITWKSSNSRVIVSSTGKVRAKKPGSSCIRAVYNGYTYYWVVNVSTDVKAKVIAAGQEIAKGTYSQPRRMSAGYYDCSSLVWRAYKPYGYNFGTNLTAPVAASEAKYLSDRNKLISGAIGKANTQGLKLQPGDLLFEGGQANGRWGGIYHVEMFRGYAISSIDSDGKPVYMNTWVNRVDGCYGYGTANDYVGRP